jgi:hypothetical protein
MHRAVQSKFTRIVGFNRHTEAVLCTLRLGKRAPRTREASSTSRKQEEPECALRETGAKLTILEKTS